MPRRGKAGRAPAHQAGMREHTRSTRAACRATRQHDLSSSDYEANDDDMQAALQISAREYAEAQGNTHGLCNMTEEEQTQLLNERLKPMGLQAGRSPPDGSCLLHAVIDQYRQHCCFLNVDPVGTP